MIILFYKLIDKIYGTNTAQIYANRMRDLTNGCVARLTVGRLNGWMSGLTDGFPD